MVEFTSGQGLRADALEPINALIDSLSGPVMLVDSLPRVVRANAPAREIFLGLRDGDALAFAIRAPNVLDSVAAVLAGGERQSVIWRERSPVERLFEIAISPFALGPRHFAVLELLDVTEARRVEQMRVNFIANASHELRTPLTTLLGFIETLQGPARHDEAARDKFLQIMGEQSRRMARLVDDLLSLSRIELSEHLKPQSTVNLAPVVRRIVDALEPLAREAGVAVEVHAPDMAEIHGEADELARLVENLVENAIKYSADGGREPRVIVSIESTPNGTQLCVRDNGPGIAAEHLPRLTERFYRVDAPKSRARGGTGLGLAIVKHIVARHRGRLQIDSQPGQGSMFLTHFPKT